MAHAGSGQVRGADAAAPHVRRLPRRHRRARLERRLAVDRGCVQGPHRTARPPVSPWGLLCPCCHRRSSVPRFNINGLEGAGISADSQVGAIAYTTRSVQRVQSWFTRRAQAVAGSGLPPWALAAQARLAAQLGWWLACAAMACLTFARRMRSRASRAAPQSVFAGPRRGLPAAHAGRAPRRARWRLLCACGRSGRRCHDRRDAARAADRLA